MTQVVEKPRIITPEGDPVDEEHTDDGDRIGYFEGQEAVEELAKEVKKGLNRFRNNTILKIGAVIVALRIVNVAGAIIIENQRLKAKQKQQDEEK